MDNVVSRWAAMPTGIMRPDYVHKMDDRIEQAYVECINLQSQQVTLTALAQPWHSLGTALAQPWHSLQQLALSRIARCEPQAGGKGREP